MKEDGFSALHLASLNGHHNVVQCLVEVRKLTYWPCCVRWNGVIWLKLSIFAHLASSCANVLRKKKTFSQGRVPAPQGWFGTPIWPPLYFFEWRLWRHNVKMLFSNFWKSLVITMPSLKLIQSESLEFSGEKSLPLWFRGLCMVFIFDLRKILPVFCRKRWCQLVRLRTAVVRIYYICQNWYEVELYRKLALSKFVDRRESPRRWIKH